MNVILFKLVLIQWGWDISNPFSVIIKVLKLFSRGLGSSKRFINEIQHTIVFTSGIMNLNAFLKGPTFFHVYHNYRSKQTKFSQRGKKILTMGKMWVL